jgi:hypothetical protein
MDIKSIKTEVQNRILELPLPFSVKKVLENREYGYTVLPGGEVVRNHDADYGPTDIQSPCHLADLDLWELAICLEAQELAASR